MYVCIYIYIIYTGMTADLVPGCGLITTHALCLGQTVQNGQPNQFWDSNVKENMCTYLDI